MRRWAVLTVALYGLCLFVFIGPLFQLDGDPELQAFDFHLFFTPVLIISQAILLLVPVAIERRRPIKRRHILASAFITGLLLTALSLGFIGATTLMITSEDGFPEAVFFSKVSVLIPIVLWSVWGIVFYKSYSSSNPGQFVTVLTRWLLRGSILELLVAVPSHIVSRQRNECCAPAFNFAGIATGISVALLAFGPGIFFLFARRVKTKKRMLQKPEPPSLEVG